MRIQFEANQDYQIAAIEATARLFDGQPPLLPGEGVFTVTANGLDLAEEDLLANLLAAQLAQGIEPDAKVKYLAGEITTEDGPATARFANFSIEMETGTGKTYVYLRTALELARRYGFRKYIIVVPSVAVREGVLKTVEMTRRHFGELFGNPSYSAYVYDSENLSRVRQFATANDIEFLVMTIDSFNKAGNLIYQSSDHLMGDTPIHLIQRTRPILILDEPQNMESEKSIAALAQLDPLFALRYSATHRNPYNLIYRLTPAAAYRQRLVKRIEVAAMVERNDTNQAYIRVESLEARKNTITARIAIHKLMKSGSIAEQTITARLGDDLEALAGRPEYAGFVIEEISVAGEYVRFTNGAEARRGIARGPDREALFRAQIRYTIEEHLRRQQRLRAYGVKVLSLFFIDRVEHYASEDGLIRRLFTEEYTRLRGQFDGWKALDAAAVHAGYFARKRLKGGATEVIDSVSGKTEADIAAYDLIMRAKERLLSFEEPVAFIFSHSALREGWDNPNVFQLCTLNQSTSEVKKRQEVGRGMRLAVDQAGQRVRDDAVNVLTVVANESYERYVATLQREIEEEFGAAGTPPAPLNARERERHTARLKRPLPPEFVELWRRISRKTRYSVHVESERLIREMVPEVDRIQVRPPRLSVTKASVELTAADTLRAVVASNPRDVANLTGHSPLPDLLSLMENLLERTSPPVHLSRRTLLEILRRTSNLAAAIANPQDFATEFVRRLKSKLVDQLADGIQYEPVEDWYEMSRLDEEMTGVRELTPSPRGVYDAVACDAGTERRFVAGLESNECVRAYLKLPGWFKVETPIGAYNPDWAIVMEERDQHGQPTDQLLYLVRETKDTINLTELSPEERHKVICGSRHFNGALHGDYQVVSAAAQLPRDGTTPR